MDSKKAPAKGVVKQRASAEGVAFKRAATNNVAQANVAQGASANGKQHFPRRKPQKDKPAEDVFAKKVKIIPLGGMGEIGKNITAFEYENDIIIVDCGVAFPGEELLGIDLVLPDFQYLIKNQEKIRGIFITHGHEDHIGSLPFFLKEVNVPVYGTKLTLGIAAGKLKEHKLSKTAKFKVVNFGNTVKVGNFKVEFIRVNHSIPDACALAIKTPAGVIFHTGDFKLDTMPVDGEMMDLTRIAELGKEGVLLMMSESTNVEREGYSKNERSLNKSFDDIFTGCNKRIIVATFASNVHRVQQIMDAAVRFGRKIAVSGRSMENIVNVSIELGYCNVPKTSLISIDEISKYPQEKLVIITTGSQGEPMSALSRMANSDHRKVNITANDLVLFSSSPIPGNERLIGKVVNELFKKGAEVIYDNIHVSGHACKEELKLIFGLVKPKFFVPVHGEYRHLKLHTNLAQEMGMDTKNIFILENGQSLEITSDSAAMGASVPSGVVYVDGNGVGDVGNIVLRDRKILASDGLIIVVVSVDSNEQIVAGPDIVSRGFVYVRESDDLMNEVKILAQKSIEDCYAKGARDWATLKNSVKTDLSDLLYKKTRRRPMVIPIIMQAN